MGDLLARIAASGKPVRAVTEPILGSGGYVMADEVGQFDPHVWMDPALWRFVVGAAREVLVKADPQGDGNFSDGIRSFSVQREDGVTVEAVITRTRTAAGEYYDILLTAYARGKEVATLNAGRYVPGKAEGQ